MKDLKGMPALWRARWSTIAFAGVLASCSVNRWADGGLVAGWNLNQVRNDAEVLLADAGKGSLSLAGLDGNWTLYSGTEVNGIVGWLPGEALGLRGSSLNGSDLIFEFDPPPLSNAVFSFAAMRSSTGFSQLGLEVLVGDDWNPYWSGEVEEAWQVASISLDPWLFERPNPRFRLVVDGANSPQGTIRFDNFRLDAFVVPNPASVSLLGVMLFAGRQRRRLANSLAGR